MSEADLYKSAKISNDAFFIQWQEADGTFVALTFNLKTMKVVSTGIYKNYKWFRSGEVVNLNTRVQSKSTKNEKKKRNQHPAHPRLHSRRRVSGKESRNSESYRKNGCERL